MSLPKYIVNWEELLDVLADRLEINLGDIGLGSFEDDLQNNLDTIIELIKDILNLLRYRHIQKIHSMAKHIPAIVNTYLFEKTFDNDIFLTGISFSQSGWKYQDQWGLEVGGKLLFDNIFTKELGEQKQFNTFYFVPAGTPVRLLLHNNSGNSRLVWFDIEYLDLGDFQKLPVPDIPDSELPPDVPPIENDFDWLAVLRWESNTSTDIDFHACIDCDPDQHVYYSSKEYEIDEKNKMWLNYDFTSHGADGRREAPEIITILGMKEKVINLYITNYDLGDISEDVTIDIYRNIYGSTVHVHKTTVRPEQITGEQSFYIGNIRNDKFYPIEENVPYFQNYIDPAYCGIDFERGS